ncbi:hypothetical protein HN51_018527 [Arachis hypogaea]|uniref:Uncharacterized protein n=1 Tax=Arachis hypogaea TaxID=3818 RepID=A0A445BTT7_ARAHY|nr:uncharacterized protein LOC112706205 [Arachis hypogaea]QHO30125.1 uncharacterized protein DS421_8g230630 [Arachis hypogaea]RYR42016.1 hypothetical protein Ahy_A08g038466 isoform A [Arachis hypogaea]RYR42017.1 hypothetical protein Ahy_A08g038466 isoform B [Arachis hypogaea]
MDLPREVDDYIKETIDDCLGLPISSKTLVTKLRASRESERRLQEQNLYLLSKLKQKDELVERTKCESSMNAQALKKFVEENQRLAMECENLLAKCQNLENECVLFEHDREALMEFGNDADGRAREAQSRVLDLERELLLLQEEFRKYKTYHELADTSSTFTLEEENLLDSLLATITSGDDYCTYTFLEANSKDEYCKKLLTMWDCLKPSSQKVLSLVAKVKSLEKDKEHLTTNLLKAEEEVKLLFNENNTLEKENKVLLKHYKERNHPSSGEKHTSSASAKSNKRKSSPRTSNPIDRKIDFDDIDSTRQPLSPLRMNSPDCRMNKK